MEVTFFSRFRNNLDVVLPITIAVFAAILAINDLFSGMYGSQELHLANQRNNAYQWYQSKSLKETLTEGQLDLVKVLLISGSITPDKQNDLVKLSNSLEGRLHKLRAEKNEILLGSRVIGQHNWIQDIDGHLGKVVGAKEYERNIEILGKAGEYFNMASMLFQITIVMGSVALIIVRHQVKWLFFKATAVAGMVGLSLSILGGWLIS